MLRSDDPQLLALEAAHLEHEPVGDVARRADRPAAGRPVGEQPPARARTRRSAGRPSPTPIPGTRLELERPSPGRARSGRRAGRARPRRGRPPTGRATRSPRAARSAPRRDSPAAPRSASRSRGRSAGGISRIARPAERPGSDVASAIVAPCWRRAGVPGPERRKPADSSRHPDPGTQANATGGPSPGDQPGLHRAAVAGRRGSGPRQPCTRRLGEDEEDRVERRVEPDRRPDRAARGRRASRGRRRPAAASRTRRRSRPATSPSDVAATREDVGEGEEQRRPDDRPAGRRSSRCQAVIAKPRNRISSATGAMTAPAISWSEQAADRPGRRQRAGRARPGSGRRGPRRASDGHDDHRQRERAHRTRGRRRPAGRTAGAHLGPATGRPCRRRSGARCR